MWKVISNELKVNNFAERREKLFFREGGGRVHKSQYCRFKTLLPLFLKIRKIILLHDPLTTLTFLKCSKSPEIESGIHVKFIQSLIHFALQKLWKELYSYPVQALHQTKHINKKKSFQRNLQSHCSHLISSNTCSECSLNVGTHKGNLTKEGHSLNFCLLFSNGAQFLKNTCENTFFCGSLFYLVDLFKFSSLWSKITYEFCFYWFVSNDVSYNYTKSQKVSLAFYWPFWYSKAK